MCGTCSTHGAEDTCVCFNVEKEAALKIEV
jgi:hypothetical protein